MELKIINLTIIKGNVMIIVHIFEFLGINIEKSYYYNINSIK